MIIDHENPTLALSNIVANPSFGTLVTEAGSGYAVANSGEYKLTPGP